MVFPFVSFYLFIYLGDKGEYEACIHLIEMSLQLPVPKNYNQVHFVGMY